MVQLTSSRGQRTPELIETRQCHIHPLLIDHVVQKILEYVNGNDAVNYDNPISNISSQSSLFPYRLVCKLWNEVASSLLRAKHQVEVGSYSVSVPKFRRLIKLRKSHPHRKNSRKQNADAFSTWPSPLAKFRLCQEIFQPMYAPVITDFFQTFQDTLEVLDVWLDLRSTLVDITLNGNSAFEHYTFPNLKTLVYEDRRVVLDSSQDLRGVLLKSLVNIAPNLQSLTVRFQRDFRGSIEFGSDVVYDKLKEIFYRGSQVQKSLKHLKLDLHVNDTLLNCLCSTGFHLESLELAIRGSTFSFIAFRQFLESVQSYLKRLKLCNIERDSRCMISFPRMTTLCELEIDGTDAFSKHAVSFGDFSYKENLPHLHILRINIWATVNLQWNQFFPQRKSQVWHLTELKLPGELCDTTMIQTAANVFPNLRNFQVSLYSQTLHAMEVIFENMTQLEELTIWKFPSLWDRNEKNIDHIMTGISPSCCEKLVRENICLNKINDHQLAKMKIRPGLTNLKKLRKFIMPDLQFQASYSDITGYFALLKMPNLRYLSVGRSCISTACLSLLIGKFPEMEAQRRIVPTNYKEPDDDDDASFLELPGDTCLTRRTPMESSEILGEYVPLFPDFPMKILEVI